MDYHRAHEIFLSKGIINVQYDNEPIWIKNINRANLKAEIEFLNHPGDSKFVNVAKLNESE